MKYLTKDWYNKMQCSSLHVLLKVDKRAEEKNETFYQKLYKKSLKEYIKNETYLLNYKKFKKVLLENKDLLENLNEETIKEKYENYKKEMFLGMTLEQAFDYRQTNIIEDLKEKLPKDILDKVKDIRVLALDYASKEVYDLIKKFSEENEKYVDNKFKEYIKLENEMFDDSFELLNTSFHDCYIEKCEKNKKDMIINFNTGGFSEKENIIFKNYKVILDENIENTFWLYEEIYKNKSKYEVHILTIKDKDLKELILTCDDIILK